MQTKKATQNHPEPTHGESSDQEAAETTFKDPFANTLRSSKGDG
jgi:hypothetical protein